MGEATLADALAAAGNRQPTELSHHVAPCCDIAAAWFYAMARAQRSTCSGLAWIADRWRWGPVRWPLYWCEVVTSHRLDCGGHAALARVLYEARVLEVLAAQVIEKYDATTTEGWRAAWTRADSAVIWSWGSYAYHEAIATRDGDQLHFWDVTSARAIDEPHDGYGGVVAVRVAGRGWRALWSGHAITAGTWTQVAV